MPHAKIWPQWIQRERNNLGHINLRLMRLRGRQRPKAQPQNVTTQTRKHTETSHSQELWALRLRYRKRNASLRASSPRFVIRYFAVSSATKPTLTRRCNSVPFKTPMARPCWPAVLSCFSRSTSPAVRIKRAPCCWADADEGLEAGFAVVHFLKREPQAQTGALAHTVSVGTGCHLCSSRKVPRICKRALNGLS